MTEFRLWLFIVLKPEAWILPGLQGTQILPPMTALPPPLGPGSSPVAGIDLQVDYETEVKPFLGRCLVRTTRV